MIIDEDWAYDKARQRRLDSEPDGDPYEERKLREREEDQKRKGCDHEHRPS